MYIKKSGGKIFGATLTAAEKKAMEIEIRAEMAEYHKKHYREIDAIILWVLHEQERYGKIKLKRFYKSFVPAIDNLLKRYEMDTSECAWLCTRKLKEIGIDLEELEKEKETE